VFIAVKKGKRKIMTNEKIIERLEAAGFPKAKAVH